MPATSPINGIAPNDTVAILLPNSVAWVESWFAIARAGAISVPISYDSTETEIAYRLADADCKAVITTAERGDLCRAAAGSAPNLETLIVTDRGTCSARGTCATPSLWHAAAIGAARSGFAARRRLSFSTRRARPAAPRACGSPCMACCGSTAACWTPIAGLSERDTMLSPLPLFHSYALNLSVLSILATGATEYIMEKFSTSEAVRLLKTGEFTFFPGVPTMFHYLLQATRGETESEISPICGFAFRPAPSCRRRSTANSKSHLGVTVARRLRHHRNLDHGDHELADRRPRAGIVRHSGARARGAHRRSATADDVAPSQEGELIVRGPNVMPGYHNKPEETKMRCAPAGITPAIWRRATRTAFITITGRLKELIIRGGQNIAPAEIEEVVNTFAAVLDCAVVGVAHEHLGEVPALFVVPRPGQRCRKRGAARPLPHASVGVQGAAHRANDRRNPSHRVGQDHPLQAARIIKGLKS